MKFFRKTVIGVSSIVFTAITLGTATYAWFPINSQSNVNDMSLSVHGGLGFLVSVDNVNYKNELTKDDLYNAMLVNYLPEQYMIAYDATSKTSILYHTKYVQKKDENGDPLYTTDADNNQIPVMEYVPDTDNPATATEKANAFKNIELMPLTSSDGVHLTDLYNSSASATSGRFIEFSVYFRTSTQGGNYVKASEYSADHTYYELTKVDDVETYTVATGVTEENYKNYYTFDGFIYDVYLNGETQYSDAYAGHEATEISPTRFMSVPTKVDLSANMTAVIDGNPTNLTKGGNVTVYSSNAIRMSVTDENAYVSSGETAGVNVYELNDFVYGASDLGSYATTYDSDWVTAYVDAFKSLQLASNPDFDFDAYIADLTATYGEGYCEALGLVYSDDLFYKFNYQNNAMYTYYTNLKQSNALYNSLNAYDQIPTTIKDLTSKDGNGDYIYNKKITTLSSAEDGKLITFRIWLEGWDADCFDGLKDAITASLSFSSKRIY
jgi:hypothetical protein